MKKLLESKTIENFFLAATCATVFTMSLCYWILELTYKYNHNKDSIVDINWVAGAGLIISAYYLLKKGRVNFDPTLFFLIHLAVLIAVIDYHNGEFIKICYAWFLPTAYIIGKLVVSYDNKTYGNNVDILKKNTAAEKRTFLVVAALILGMFTISFSDFWPNWRSGWAFGTENWSSTWAQNTTARTTFILGFVPIISIAGLVFFIRNRFIIIFITAMNIIAMYCAIKTEGREPILMLPIALVVILLMKIVDMWSELNRKKKLLLILIPAIIICICFIGFQLNLFNVKDIYNASYFSSGGGILKNQRIILNGWAINNIIQFPTENTSIYALYQGHNMTLNLASYYDVTIMILIILVKLFYLVEAIRLIKNKKCGIVKYVLVPVFVNLNIYYVLEPNAAYAREYWMAGLLVSGLIAGWNEIIKKTYC